MNGPLGFKFGEKLIRREERMTDEVVKLCMQRVPTRGGPVIDCALARARVAGQ